MATKDYMLIQCLIPSNTVHKTCSWLEDNGAREMMVRPYRNGANGAAEAAPKTNAERGANQLHWLLKHIKDETAVADIKDGWVKAGFPATSIYAALARAVAQKHFKKLGAGTYKPTGQ